MEAILLPRSAHGPEGGDAGRCPQGKDEARGPACRAPEGPALGAAGADAGAGRCQGALSG